MISFKETHANLFWSVISCINEFLSYRNSSENSATRSCICKANEHQISLKTYEFGDPNTARRARHPKHHPNSLPKPSTITFSNCEAGDTPRTPHVRPGHSLILCSLLPLLSNGTHGNDTTHRDVTGAKSRTQKFLDFEKLWSKQVCFISLFEIASKISFFIAYVNRSDHQMGGYFWCCS